MAIDKDNTISLEAYQVSNEDLKGYFLANSAFFAGGFENKIKRTRQEIENLTKMIMELNAEGGKEALKNGTITKSDYTKNVTDMSKKDFLVAALKGQFLGYASLGLRGWKRGDELKRLQKELQEKLKEFDDAVVKAISTEDYEDTVSNPETDDRIDNVEEVEAMTKVKEDEIEEIASQIEECVEVDTILDKVEQIAQEALDTNKADTRVGEITHIALTELFGRVGITTEANLPSVESFKKPETATYAMGISLDSIREARKTIQSSMETADRLMNVKVHEINVANEALMDDVKDFLGKKSNAKQVARIGEFTGLLKEASTRSLNKDMKEESGLKYYFNSPRALSYLGKDGGVVPDLSKGIFEDAENLSKLTNLLATINKELIKEEPSKESIVNAAKQLEDAAFQGNVYITINKSGKVKTKSEYVRPHTEKSTQLGFMFVHAFPSAVTGKALFTMLGLSGLGTAWAAGTTLSGIVGSYIHKKLNNRMAEQDIIKIEDSLFKAQGNFKQVATKYATEMEKFQKAASDFQAIIEDKTKSDSEIVRETIRIGHATINSVIGVIKAAEPFYKRVA